MIRLSIPGGRIGNFLAGAAVASVLSGAALAVTSPNFTYSAPQNGFFSISPLHMAPDSDEAAADFFISYSGILTSDGGFCYQTGVNLPNGATLTTVSTWFESGAGSNIQIFLFRYNLVTGTTTELTGFTPNDDTGIRRVTTQTVESANALVNNVQNAYAYAVCLGDSTEFFGARINYKYTSAGD